LTAVLAALVSHAKRERGDAVFSVYDCRLAAGGCAMSSGIMPAGPDTYMLSKHNAPIREGAITAQQEALTEANAFCTGQGKVFLPSKMQTPASANPYGPTNLSITFRCLPVDHPDVATYLLRRSPNYIIEQRNR
jgi:hypothetical protein